MSFYRYPVGSVVRPSSRDGVRRGEWGTAVRGDMHAKKRTHADPPLGSHYKRSPFLRLGVLRPHPSTPGYFPITGRFTAEPQELPRRPPATTRQSQNGRTDQSRSPGKGKPQTAVIMPQGHISRKIITRKPSRNVDKTLIYCQKQGVLLIHVDKTLISTAVPLIPY